MIVDNDAIQKLKKLSATEIFFQIWKNISVQGKENSLLFSFRIYSNNLWGIEIS